MPDQFRRLYGGDLLEGSSVDPNNDLIAIRDSSVATDQKHKEVTPNEFKIAISLGNVDNTSDLNKPISNSTQNSLNNLQAQIDSLAHIPMDILTLTNTVNIAEIGSTVTSITFNWTVNKTPAFLSFNQGIGAITPPSLLTKTQAVSITSATTYMLTASDGTSYPNNTDTASTTVLFQSKAYWGTSAFSTLNSAQIIALSNSSFSTSRVRSFTINGNGQYIYYCYPASFGDATFTVNGLVNTAWTKTVFSFTNASGATVSYNVYRTNTVQNGDNIQISIS